MRYQEEIKPKPSVGREFQHLEDLVFIEGTAGAKRVLRILENLSESTQGVSIKWDGNPTIYWGRNPAGEFVLVNKNAWGKTECTNAAMLEEFILTSGKGEEWRPAFAESLVKIWPLVEAATPHWFRGYVYGDLLFYPDRPAQDESGCVVFTPNKVTYTACLDTEMGKKLSQAKVCVAVHKEHRRFGDSEGSFFLQGHLLESKDVAVISQTSVTTNIIVEKEKIKSLDNLINEQIDDFLAPQYGLSDLRKILYTYVNQTSKAGQLVTLGESFFDWLETSKTSLSKQDRIITLAENNPHALLSIFMLVNGVINLKNNVIEQFDAGNTEIAANTKGQAGGEGYIMMDERVKLVPRHRWKPN